MRTLQSTADRQSIEKRISALSPDDRRRWGKMSAHEMVCHLCDSYRLALGEKTSSPATGFLQRTLVKWIALGAPIRWPKGVRTRPEMEQGVGGTAPGAFEEDRRKLLVLLDRFRGDSVDISIPHPIFGPLTRAEWLRWGYRHADHHLRQFGQ
jgi:DinB superfamily